MDLILIWFALALVAGLSGICAWVAIHVHACVHGLKVAFAKTDANLAHLVNDLSKEGSTREETTRALVEELRQVRNIIGYLNK